MKIGAVREYWIVRTPVTPPAIHGLVRRNEKPQQLGFRHSNRLSRGVVMAVQGGRGYGSPWDEKPYETLPTGKKVYVDESDVVTFLDPPKELIPLDPSSYNPAAYLWKKIEDIPEERRHRLLQFIEPRLISRAWEIAGARYENPKLAKMTASKLFSTGGDAEISLEYFNCRTSNGPLIISWIKSFKMAVFSSNNGQIYGRICGGPIVSTLANAFSPLYFEVIEAMEVMATEEPCDIACRFGAGLLAIEDYPQGFPRPAKHPYPFNDSVVIYIRHIGPGVCVGQAWQEGKELQQVPQRLCSDILIVKQYNLN
ncbi:WD repeat protein [Hirschfeldia incana]|nr:WD repeat protein [Hirschfeldia incana]KAJ0232062.1 WD repeat protein [Hirschfeldia incana]